MTVNDGYSSRIGDGDMIRLYAYELAKLLMRMVHGQVSAAPTALV